MLQDIYLAWNVYSSWAWRHPGPQIAVLSMCTKYAGRGLGGDRVQPGLGVGIRQMRGWVPGGEGGGRHGGLHPGLVVGAMSRMQHTWCYPLIPPPPPPQFDRRGRLFSWSQLPSLPPSLLLSLASPRCGLGPRPVHEFMEAGGEEEEGSRRRSRRWWIPPVAPHTREEAAHRWEEGGSWREGGGGRAEQVEGGFIWTHFWRKKNIDW